MAVVICPLKNDIYEAVGMDYVRLSVDDTAIYIY